MDRKEQLQAINDQIYKLEEQKEQLESEYDSFSKEKLFELLKGSKWTYLPYYRGLSLIVDRENKNSINNILHDYLNKGLNLSHCGRYIVDDEKNIVIGGDDASSYELSINNIKNLDDYNVLKILINFSKKYKLKIYLDRVKQNIKDEEYRVKRAKKVLTNILKLLK